MTFMNVNYRKDVLIKKEHLELFYHLFLKSIDKKYYTINH